MKIAIKTKERLNFPPSYFGFIETKIDMIQNKPEQEVYELKIIDTCYDFTDEQVIKIVHSFTETGESHMEEVEETMRVKKIYNTHVAFKTYSYEKLSQLSSVLNLQRSDYHTETDYINALFLHGLLAETQKECIEGLHGTGKGKFHTTADQWEIVTENE